MKNEKLNLPDCVTQELKMKNQNSQIINLKSKICLLLFAMLLVSSAFGQRLITVDSAGYALQKFYLSQHVDSLWRSGQHVNWETGQAEISTSTKDKGAHCSAFVASVCKQKNIYILRPPKHETELLANAQYTWLHSAEAAAQGWTPLKQNPMERAQQLADSGVMVVVCYKNPNPKWSGHIAFVMPSDISTDSIAASGPRLIQAGKTNSNNMSLKAAFGRHIKDWTQVTGGVAFFYVDKRIKN